MDGYEPDTGDRAFSSFGRSDQTWPVRAAFARGRSDRKRSNPWRSVGLVTDGRQVIYRAQPNGLAPLMDWLGHYEGFWRERFNQMEDLLREMDQ